MTKYEFLQQATKAFAEGEMDFLFEHMADDVVWKMAGGDTIHGKEEFIQFTKAMDGPPKLDLTIDRILIDGADGAVTGKMKMEKEDGKTGKFTYCDIYRFSSDKENHIKELTTLVIEEK